MKTLLVFIVCALFFVGCESESGTDGGLANQMNGSVTGYIMLASPAGQAKKDHSGAIVSIEGTSLFAVTDQDGKWTLNGIPNGTYTFMFSKPGYSYHKYYMMQIVGEQMQYWSSRSLYEIPTFVSAYDLKAGPFTVGYGYETHDSTFTDSTGFVHTIRVGLYKALENETGLFTLSLRMPPMPNYYILTGAVFFSKNENIDIHDPSSYLIMSSAVMNSYSCDTIMPITVYRSQLISSGFKPGERVFCVGYGGTTASDDSYYDPLSKKYIYSGFSPKRTAVIEFNVP